MTASSTRLAELLRFTRAAPGSSAKADRCTLGVALCTLALLAAVPDNALAQGSLVSWGFDDFGEVSDTPAGSFVAVAAGSGHNVAIRTDGTLVSWGFDYFGQVSDTPSSGIYTAVAAGAGHSVAIRTDGTLVSWGSNYAGLVSNTPTTGTYTAVAAGNYHSVAIRTDGTLVTWPDDGDTPAGTYTAIAAGDYHSIAIRTDGTLASWGSDYPNAATGPVVRTPTTGTYTAIAAGSAYSVAIRTDGTLISWGYDDVGSVNDTPTTGTYTAVAAGEQFGVALRTDGTLIAWGFISQVTDTPAGHFSAIAAKSYHGVAIVRQTAQQQAQQQIADLSLSVQALVVAGVSLPANGKSLLTKLDAVDAALERNDVQAAIGSLNAFIHQVEAFIQSGKLTPAQGQSLIEATLMIIAALGG